MSHQVNNQKSFNFSLSIAADDYLRLYQGSATSVLATSWDGKRVRFPAKVLQPFVTHDGVKGDFSIHFDQNYRFISIERL